MHGDHLLSVGPECDSWKEGNSRERFGFRSGWHVGFKLDKPCIYEKATR